MARDNHGYGVGRIGAPHRAGGRRIADPPRQFAIADGLAKRDTDQLSPDSLLELAAFRRQGKIEGLPLAGKEFVNLTGDFGVESDSGAPVVAVAKTEHRDRPVCIHRNPCGPEWRLKPHRYFLLSNSSRRDRLPDFGTARSATSPRRAE